VSVRSLAQFVAEEAAEGGDPARGPRPRQYSADGMLTVRRPVACPTGRPPLPQVACSGNGVCNGGTGQCRCEAGWAGDACGDRDLRPCNVQGFHGRPQRTSSYCDGRCVYALALALSPLPTDVPAPALGLG